MIPTSDVPVRDFIQANTTRLISTAYIDEPALSPLADDDDDLAFLEALEQLSSSRLGVPEFIPSGVHPDELVNEHHGYGWTYVNAAFCYTRETGNRFNGPDRGAWYATWGDDRIETAHAEVTWHLTRELDATGIYENTTAYRELHAAFATSFHDVVAMTNSPIFDLDPDIGYPAGQQLAASLLTGGSNGLLYPSVRKEGSQCLAAFRPHILQNIRQGDTWVFEWKESRAPTIKSI